MTWRWEGSIKVMQRSCAVSPMLCGIFTTVFRFVDETAASRAVK